MSRDRSHQQKNDFGASLREVDLSQAPTGERGANEGTLTAAQIIAQKRGKAIQSLLSSKELRVGAFVWTPVGLRIDGEANEVDWIETGKILKQIDSSLQWLIGDFIAYGEDLRFGQQKEIAEEFGFKYGTVREYARVARAIELSIRVDKLDFKHHQIVAALSPKEQKYWLKEAVDNSWSTRQLYDAIHGKKDDDTVMKWRSPLLDFHNKIIGESRKKWNAMNKKQRRWFYEELRGIVDWMSQEFPDDE